MFSCEKSRSQAKGAWQGGREAHGKPMWILDLVDLEHDRRRRPSDEGPEQLAKE